MLKQSFLVFLNSNSELLLRKLDIEVWGDSPMFYGLPSLVNHEHLTETTQENETHKKSVYELIDFSMKELVRCGNLNKTSEANINEIKVQCLKELVFLGRKSSDFFVGTQNIDFEFWLIYGGISNILYNEFSASSEKEFEWITCRNIVQGFYLWTMVTSPEVLQISNNFISSPNIELSTQTCKTSLESQSKPEYAPCIQCFPMLSNTMKPFIHTNLVVVNSAGEWLLVDPGASLNTERSHFHLILSRFAELSSASPKVFITHHHYDHWEALPLIEEKFPNVILLGHKLTLDRLNTSLQKHAVSSNEEIIVGDVKLCAIYAPGHTDGHMALFEPRTSTLIPGDHLVGYGSAYLDFICGDMREYFDTTRHLISLGPRLALPAHGPPIYKPVHLLNAYIKHRQERENSIFAAVQQGCVTEEEIVRLVYKDVSPEMWEHAKSNIRLHLRKLQQDGKLKSQRNLSGL